MTETGVTCNRGKHFDEIQTSVMRFWRPKG